MNCLIMSHDQLLKFYWTILSHVISYFNSIGLSHMISLKKSAVFLPQYMVPYVGILSFEFCWFIMEVKMFTNLEKKKHWQVSWKGLIFDYVNLF